MSILPSDPGTDAVLALGMMHVIFSDGAGGSRVHAARARTDVRSCGRMR